MSATLNRRSVAEIVSALKTALTAATWTPAGGAEQAAFDRVELFDIADIEKAFEFILASEQRVCLIIADSEQFPVAGGGQKIFLKRTLPVALLISDGVIGDRVAALFGGVNGATPVAGAENLKESAIKAVTGQLIDPDETAIGVICAPESSHNITVRTETNLTGRACVELDLVCTGGTIEAATARAGNL